MRKRSLSIEGHRTSLALEPEFWAGVEAMAMAAGIGLTQLIAEIDRRRTGANLSSALRVAVLAFYRDGTLPRLEG